MSVSQQQSLISWRIIALYIFPAHSARNPLFGEALTYEDFLEVYQHKKVRKLKNYQNMLYN